MADRELKTPIAQRLQALKGGGEAAKMATADIENDASLPDLKPALQQGDKASGQWAQRISKAIE